MRTHPMQLYLLRHGDAVNAAVDDERPLSVAGRACIEGVAGGLRAAGVGFDAIVASPKTRAWQTAEIVARATGYAPSRIRETETVKPSGEPAEALAYLGTLKRARRVLVAGHMPSLAEIASLLLAPGTSLPLRFDCGSLACLEVDDLEPGNGALLWFLTPAQAAELRP